MCVAAIVFNPVPLSDLKDMEDSNPHGAGVAWEQDGIIHFKKGLTAAQIHEMQENKVMTFPYLMHYRWATHGDKCPQLTHPFPIGPRALMGEIEGTAEAVLIHNGTWNIYEKKAAEYVNLGNYEFPIAVLDAQSDTAIAAWLAKDNPNILDGVQWATAVAEMKVEPDGVRKMEITTRGEWHDKDGNWYSNLNWVSRGYVSYYGDSNSDWKAWSNYYTKRETENEKKHRYLEANPDKDNRPVYERYMDRITYDMDAVPFAHRRGEDEHLDYDKYVNKYGQKREISNTPANGNRTEASMPPDDIEAAWQEYLNWRGDHNQNSDESSFRSSLPDERRAENLCKPFCGAGTEWNYPPDTATETESDDNTGSSSLIDIDPDIISEDFETVNEVLRRAAGK